MTDFIIQLKRLASSCQFGSFLNEALRDKLVCGLYSESIIKELYRKFDAQPTL